ncbi:hypothetical protein F2Q70_00020305 [Brassica cretica]|uniref:Uncharacterized protein n=1 Tax=Brassica cretica TaxID=69181 RepID=A0A8S9GKY2_BRACR|nr:hypothetical protein F2Q70_00020305 [Brassica cretica]
MSSSSSSSSRQRTMGGIPTQCWCGRMWRSLSKRPKRIRVGGFTGVRLQCRDVRDMRKSMMEHFKVQETRLDKMEEEAMRTKMNEEVLETYIWYYGKGSGN